MELLKSSSAVALYYQLKEILSKKILDNVWPYGTKLPTEYELCEQYGVSRITVRRALAELENEGLIVRKQGLGTFVSIPKIEQNLASFYSFSEEFQRRGLIPKNEVTEFSVQQPDAEMQRVFSLGKEQEIYAFTRLRFANEIPIAIESTYLPVHLFPGLEREALVEYSLYQIMNEKFQVIASTAQESFGASALGKEEANIFGLKVGAPAFDLERLAYRGAECVEYTKGIVRGDKFRFRVRLD